MIIFNAGFILGLNNKIPVILAGGTQMACVLLVINKILELWERIILKHLNCIQLLGIIGCNLIEFFVGYYDGGDVQFLKSN